MVQSINNALEDKWHFPVIHLNGFIANFLKEIILSMKQKVTSVKTLYWN